MEEKSFIEFSLTVLPATPETGSRPAENPDTPESHGTARALVKVAVDRATPWERQGMGCFFSGDSKVGAGCFPFRSVTLNPALSRPPLG